MSFWVLVHGVGMGAGAPGPDSVSGTLASQVPAHTSALIGTVTVVVPPAPTPVEFVSYAGGGTIPRLEKVYVTVEPSKLYAEDEAILLAFMSFVVSHGRE